MGCRCSRLVRRNEGWLGARICPVWITRHGERRQEKNIAAIWSLEVVVCRSDECMEVGSVVRRLLWLCGQQEGRMTMARGRHRWKTGQTCDEEKKEPNLPGRLDNRAGQACNY